MKETFGEFIKRLRLENSMTLTQLAAKLDMDSAVLCKIENGKRDFDEKRLVKLANTFNLDCPGMGTGREGQQGFTIRVKHLNLCRQCQTAADDHLVRQGRAGIKYRDMDCISARNSACRGRLLLMPSSRSFRISSRPRAVGRSTRMGCCALVCRSTRSPSTSFRAATRQRSECRTSPAVRATRDALHPPNPFHCPVPTAHQIAPPITSKTSELRRYRQTATRPNRWHTQISTVMMFSVSAGTRSAPPDTDDTCASESVSSAVPRRCWHCRRRLLLAAIRPASDLPSTTTLTLIIFDQCIRLCH